MHPYLVPMYAELKAHRCAPNAAAVQAYMKDIAPFFGLLTKDRRSIMKAHLSEYGAPKLEDLPAIVRSAYTCKEREMHYVAMDLMVKYAKKLTPDHMPLLEELITTHSWWDTVDALAVNVVGVILRKHPRSIKEWNKRWVTSGNMWLNRTALLFQLKWKEDTDKELLFANIVRHADHKDFFIRKAIGWALRSYAETEPEAVKAFVASHELFPLSRREALRKL